MGSSPAAAGRTRLPWRSAAAGWVAFAACVVAGAPLFLRMPLWIDTTLYDLAARCVLAGGVHYRDVFDTNTPGFVWLMCGVRSVLGPSTEAARVVDLVFVTAACGLLLRLARAAGATAAGVAWSAAGCAGFYLFISEFNHAQRDVWMMLPVLAATGLRLRRVAAARTGLVGDGWLFRTAVLEGVVWGAAVWIKPHVVPIAVAIWAVVQGGLAGSVPRGGRRRRAAADISGALVGGLAAGAAGIGWLVATGTWAHFVDVFTNWNTSYFDQMASELGERYEFQLSYFPPWSLFAVLAVPVALLNLIDARPWAVRGEGECPEFVGRWLPGWFYAGPADADARATRAVLAALYLSWLLTAFLLQKRYHYVHVPETLIMIAVLAANRWVIAAPVLVLQFGVMVWVAAAPALTGSPVPSWTWEGRVFRHVVWAYPDRCPDRLRWWTACLARQVPGEVRNGVAFQSDFFAGIDSAEIDEVAEYLREQDVREGEVMAWNDSPHAVYLALGHSRPPIRFLHLSTATGMGEGQYARVKAEVERVAPGVRFVVSDLRRLSLFYDYGDQLRITEPGPSAEDHLPPVVPMDSRGVFPLNQPTVFRSGGGRGRYVVHVLIGPIGEIYTPH
ncbi:MAG TPA: hypothetical protein VH092_09060 [Urbifossiella sp.]|jgi:hypothetical protein|nr:hypothetical protein [Urbifossiella sp.]